MGSQISLLIILDPSEAFNVDASEAKLKELTVMIDKKWRIHLISSKAIYYQNLTCNFQVHPVGILSSPDSLISRIIYLLFSICKGVSVTRKYHIPIIMSKDGHLHLGLVAYAIKRITNRKCIIRVNENEVLALLLFIKRLQTPILSRRIFLRILELVLRNIENRLFKLADYILTHGPTDFQRISGPRRFWGG